jgi:hypothetical protein
LLLSRRQSLLLLLILILHHQIILIGFLGERAASLAMFVGVFVNVIEGRVQSVAAITFVGHSGSLGSAAKAREELLALAPVVVAQVVPVCHRGFG